MRLVDTRGRTLAADDAVGAAAAALHSAQIVAVKGIGGFHLACLADDEAAVQALRARKRRDAKPFAVMVRDLQAAERLIDIRETEAALLRGRERPIVFTTGLRMPPPPPASRSPAGMAPI